jgi:hypothetical protein
MATSLRVSSAVEMISALQQQESGKLLMTLASEGRYEFNFLAYKLMRLARLYVPLPAKHCVGCLLLCICSFACTSWVGRAMPPSY